MTNTWSYWFLLLLLYYMQAIAQGSQDSKLTRWDCNEPCPLVSLLNSFLLPFIIPSMFLKHYLFGFWFFDTGFLHVALVPILELAHVDQADLELTEVRLPLPPECGIKGMRHHLAKHS